MESTIYTIYLYNFEKKTFTDQQLYFNNEKDAVNYCAVFYKEIAFKILRRCYDVRDFLKEKEEE